MTITGFYVLVALASTLGFIAMVSFALLLVYRGSITFVFAGLVASLFAVMLGFFIDLNWNAAGLYQEAVGNPVRASVTHLTFFTGVTGFTDWVRVDTDQGVFFLTSVAPVPQAGTVYLVTRRKAFGDATRIFICIKPAAGCWPTLDDLE